MSRVPLRPLITAVWLVLLVAVLIDHAPLDFQDPPGLSWSRGEYTDPGFYLNNARSLVLTGEYMVGDWNNGILFPIFHSLAYLAWRIAGYSFYPLTVLLGLIAAGTVTLLGFGLARSHKRVTGFLAATWFAIEAPPYLLARVPLLENLLVLVLVAIFLVLTWNESRIRHLALLILVVLALGTKYSAFFILIPLAGVWLARRSGRLADTPPSPAEARWLWLPLVILALLGLGALLATQPSVLLATIGDKLTRYRSGAPFSRYLMLPIESNLFWRMPILTISAWLGFGALCFREKRWTRPDLFAVLAIIGWYLSIVFVRYNPARYQLPVVPFLLYLAVRFWTIVWGAPVVSWWRVAAWAGTSFALGWSAWYTAARSFGLLTGPGGRAVVLVAALLAAAGAAIMLRSRPAGRNLGWCCLVLLAVIFAFSWPQVMRENWEQDYKLSTIGRELADLVPPGETVAGWYAPSVCLHNRVRVYTTYALTPEKIATHRVRYLLLETWGPGTPPLAAAPDGSLFPLRDRLRPRGEWTIPRIGRSLALYEVLP